MRLDDRLLEQAKRAAAGQGVTLTALIERGLRLVIAKKALSPARRRVTLPVSRARGGVLPGVDLNDSAALYDIMEGTRIGRPRSPGGRRR